MHDLKEIRENPDRFDAGLKRRGLAPMAEKIRALDAEARALTTRLQELQTKRNSASKAIGAAKAKKDEAEAARLMAEVESVKLEMPKLQFNMQAIQVELDDILTAIPNLPSSDTPDGKDESENVEVRKWGEPRRLNNAKEHFDIGEAMGLMDFETAAKMSGARFVLLKGALARMERAIANLMLDTHTGEFGYTEYLPPLIVNPNATFGTGQLPKFEQDLFTIERDLAVFLDEFLSRRANAVDEINRLKVVRENASAELEAAKQLLQKIANSDDDAAVSLRFQEVSKKFIENAKNFDLERNDLNRLISRFKEATASGRSKSFLIPTAEVPLTNIVADKILDADELPLRFTAWTPCFRSEAGAAGKDTRGMIRMHQFSKVELVSITAPDKSNEEHERMTGCAEAILKKLDLPFRTVALCTGDMGFQARKTYDIEVWLPGQNRYREISSCSNCGDFQARRMKARFRKKGEKGTEFVHTLNGSGLAVGRTLVAVLENYQQEDGSVAVPEALQAYMGGMKIIGGKE